MDIVEIARRWPAGLPVVTAGLGAAAAVCVIGIPKLWSAEAAGWASAVATTAAVFAALYVGLAPQKAQRADHVRRARAVGAVVQARFLRMENDLWVVKILCETGPWDEVTWSFVAPFLTIDPSCADGLLPYFDAMPDRVPLCVAAAIAELEWAHPKLQSYGVPGLAALESNRLAITLNPLLQSVQRARQSLEQFVTGHPSSNIETDVHRRVRALRMLMNTRKEMQGGLG